MSVTPVKLVTIVGPLADFDNVVRNCIINKEFHPESAISAMKKVKYLFPFDMNNPYAELLRRAEQLSDRVNIKLDYSPFEQSSDFSRISEYFDELGARFASLSARRIELNRIIEECDQVIHQLDYVKDVSVPLSEFFSFVYAKFRFGRMPKELYKSFEVYLEERLDTYFFPTSITRDYVYGMYMTPRPSMEQVDSLFASMQFERIRLSDRIVGSASESSENIKTDAEEAKKELVDVEEALEELRTGEREKFLSCYSYARYMNDSFNIRKYAAHTSESFYVLGWVPEPEYQKFVDGVYELDNPRIIAISDDADAVTEYTPPVKLSNAKLFKPFESFVGMYGLPSYNEIDPTPMMALTYTIICGMMFGDVGHGAVVFILGLLMWKLKNMWMGPILCYAGVASMSFGFVYNSVFGYEGLLPYEGFPILHGSNSSTGLQIAVYIGVALIIMVIVLNIINGIKQKNMEKSLFGSNGFVGLLLYLSVASIALPIIGFGENFLPLQIVGIVAGVAALIVFLREPLSKLFSRREDWKPHNIVEFILENFFELFEILLSYVTNTISFLRVGAYVISHASMMAVVFMLAKGPDGGYSIPVLIIGNIIVMAIEGLLVGIQVLRLEFYELFGRFYDGGGRSYNPVVIDYTQRNTNN